MIGHFAAAVGRDHRDAIGNLHRRGALPERIDRRVFQQPELVRDGIGTCEREAAHGLERRRIRRLAEALDDDFVDDRHSTMTTAGWSQSSWYRASSCSRDFARTTQVTLR